MTNFAKILLGLTLIGLVNLSVHSQTITINTKQFTIVEDNDLYSIYTDYIGNIKGNDYFANSNAGSFIKYSKENSITEIKSENSTSGYSYFKKFLRFRSCDSWNCNLNAVTIIDSDNNINFIGESSVSKKDGEDVLLIRKYNTEGKFISDKVLYQWKKILPIKGAGRTLILSQNKKFIMVALGYKIMVFDFIGNKIFETNLEYNADKSNFLVSNYGDVIYVNHEKSPIIIKNISSKDSKSITIPYEYERIYGMYLCPSIDSSNFYLMFNYGEQKKYFTKHAYMSNAIFSHGLMVYKIDEKSCVITDKRNINYDQKSAELSLYSPSIRKVIEDNKTLFVLIETKINWQDKGYVSHVKVDNAAIIKINKNDTTFKTLSIKKELHVEHNKYEKLAISSMFVKNDQLFLLYNTGSYFNEVNGRDIEINILKTDLDFEKTDLVSSKTKTMFYYPEFTFPLNESKFRICGKFQKTYGSASIE